MRKSMKPITFLLALCSAVAIASPASATPPDAISVRDEVFAANTESLYVLRTTTDNLGLHTSVHSETFLVKIDIASGAERYWLVYRARQDTQFDADPAKERLEASLLDRDLWHNPFAIVADAGAALAPVAVRGELDPAPAPASAEKTSRWSHREGTEFVFNHAEAMSRAKRSLAALMGEVSDVGRMAPVKTRELYAKREVDWNSCQFSRLGYPVGIGHSAFQIVRLSCHDGMEMERTSLIHAVPLSPS